MGVGAGLYMYDVVVEKFTFAISSPDEFLFYLGMLNSFLAHRASDSRSSYTMARGNACGLFLA